MIRNQLLSLLLPLLLLIPGDYFSNVHENSIGQIPGTKQPGGKINRSNEAKPSLSDISFRQEVKENILAYWIMKTKDPGKGGFYGAIANKGHVHQKANRSMVLNARILWSFSLAYKMFDEDKYLYTAQRAYNYVMKHFWDDKHGGFFWSVDYKGNKQDPKKQVYAEAFGIYALTEYYMATRDEESLEKAKATYRLLEKHAYDKEHGGYFEAYERNWELSDDLQLSEVDMNTLKSMNTHLHVLEAYTNLYRVWKDEQVKARLEEMITIFLEKIINRENYHFHLFFNEAYEVESSEISFGHDIEGSWLLYEAAEVLGNEALKERVKQVSLKMAGATLEEGVDPDGGMIYETHPDRVKDSDKHWWPQAEAVVGFYNAYQLSGEEKYKEAARKSWQFIQKHIVDKRYGEWFRRVSRDREVYQEDLKVSGWKGPYHNSRACFEMIRRLE
jgi:mannobiose 2-epimerase